MVFTHCQYITIQKNNNKKFTSEKKNTSIIQSKDICIADHVVAASLFEVHYLGHQLLSEKRKGPASPSMGLC